ncbi:unnamed protein product (plasmid) [Mycetohabitans rhizoxinica HKI 454]|uniref:Uncharacterized protein n=1 Tax=Mycetohabitans rhizoxinica (strain DSM 19002 / CIP 109453 / HKI 454) TaxID=882378 RepID=E5AUR1_MYCRK|nr:unnamed protein product [Mycetohabitans rhizoxinica HKI 454]
MLIPTTRCRLNVLYFSFSKAILDSERRRQPIVDWIKTRPHRQ